MAVDLIPYDDMASELVRLTEAPHTPIRVKAALLRLSKYHVKLFGHVGHAETALGTPRFKPGFYASNLLCELVLALQASNWPRVLILIHDALPPEREDDLDPELRKYLASLPKEQWEDASELTPWGTLACAGGS